MARLLLCACLLALPAGVRAQEGTPADESEVSRPFRGLFGLADRGRTGLDLSASLFAAYDDNIAASLIGGGTNDPRFQRSGEYGGGNAQLSYNWRGERSAFSAYGASAGNYYPDYQEPWVTSYSAGLGFSRPFGRRNEFSASQTFAYSPYFIFGFFPEEPVIDEPPVTPDDISPDLSVSELKTLRYGTSLNLSRRLSRRASITGYYSFAGTTFNEVRSDYQQHRGGFRFRRLVTEHLALRLGYGYRYVDYALVEEDDIPRVTRSHDLDVGVDYSRALSVSRRSRLSFGTGSNILVRDQGSGSPDAPTAASTRFFASGFVRFNREIGRTWGLAINYNRSATFSEVLQNPVLSDAVTTSLAGLVGRRNEVKFLASYTRGDVGFAGVDNGFESYRASASWRRAMSRYAALYAQYFYYHYIFGNEVALPTGFVRELDRQGVRAGVTVWLPLVRR